MNKDNKERETAYLLPHTHWDREWRYPIWKNRMLLVRFMDELLEILKTDPEYRCFLLDGQSVPIEDYLEIMPHRREEVLEQIRQGRIAIGPWYTLPDLYPLDGESLVRNLLKGTRTAEKLGGCLNVGYNSFGWGQTAQFPQIYKGFGIDFIVSAKKVSSDRAPQSEFMWKSPDGTVILTSRLGEHGRANFYFNSYLPAKYGVNCFSSDFRYTPERSGMAMHNAGTDHLDEDFFVIKPQMGYDPNRLAAGYTDARLASDATALPSHRLYLNGTDFSTPQGQLTAMRGDLNRLIENTDFIHCRLEEYAATLHKHLDKDKLLTIEGELRDGPACDCSGNALSSRIYLKSLNKKVQQLLIHSTEPLSALLSTMGTDYPKGFLDKAWDYLLKSHPHDSINGVTQDKTANDVEHRLYQALELAQVVFDSGIESLIKRINLSDYDKDSLLLLAYNPLPYKVSPIAKVVMASAKEAGIWDFSAVDSNGDALSVQEISRDEKAYPVHDPQARPWPFSTHRHQLYLELGEMPPMGYKVIELKAARRFSPEHFYWIPMNRAQPSSILVQDNVLENEFLRVEFNSNGSLCLKHKESGRVYNNLHYFEDSGDVGNYWAFYPPYHNRTYTTLGGNAQIYSQYSGPLSATITVEYTMELPIEGHESRYGVQGKGSRSAQTRPVIIKSRFTLEKGSCRLNVHTTLSNTVENHRLRVAFPTGIQSDWADSAGHFTVDRRPRLNQPDADGSYWPEMQTLPMQNFVDVSDAHQGLALINNCLTEYEYSNDQAGTLYLTLFRAMGNMIVTWWEAVGEFENQKGSQLLRDLTFDYAIYPHDGDWQQGEVYGQAETFATPCATYQIYGTDSGDLPVSASLFSVSNSSLILSALKQSEDSAGLILRLYNPTPHVQYGTISTHFPLASVSCVNLKEEREGELPMETPHSFKVELKSNQIYTLLLEVSHD